MARSFGRKIEKKADVEFGYKVTGYFDVGERHSIHCQGMFRHGSAGDGHGWLFTSKR